jgi:hypothetical protein
MRSRRIRTSCLWWTLVLAIALAPGPGAGQTPEQAPPDTVGSVPGIEIETSVDRAEIYVGDLITYTVAIVHDTTVELIPPPLGANLGAFEVKDYQPDLRTRLDDGRIRSETRFTVSTFTTGEYVIPPLPVTFKLADGSMKVMLAEGIPITVRSLLGDEKGDTADIKPLKAQVSHEVFEEGVDPLILWPTIAGVLLIGSGLFWWWWRRRKREEPEDTRPPWEIAFFELALLQERDLPGTAEYKQYYVELTEIVRAFLGRIYENDVLEMTTTEFAVAFRDEELPGEWFDRLIDFFKHADLVKFAKLSPEAEGPGSDFALTHDMIDDVRIDWEKKQQVEVRVVDQTAPETETEVAA